MERKRREEWRDVMMQTGKRAKRVFFGSVDREYILYNAEGECEGFWCCYRQGPLPKEYTVFYGPWFSHS